MANVCGCELKVEYVLTGPEIYDTIVICTGGSTTNLNMFTRFSSAVGDRYKVLAVDPPGRGNSEYFKDFHQYTNDNLSESILSVLLFNIPADILRTKKIICLARCAGIRILSCLAKKLLNNYRLTIDKFVAYDGWIGKCNYPQDFYHKMIDRFIPRKYFDSYHEVTEHCKNQYYDFTPEHIRCEEYWDELVSYIYKYDSNTNKFTHSWDSESLMTLYKEQLCCNSFPQCHQEWSLLNCPILLIMNQKSKMLTAEILVQMLSNEKEYELVSPQRKLSVIVVPEYGHISAIDPWVLIKIINFLQD